MASEQRGTPDYPRWVRICGYGAIAAALPTVVWRVVVGLGPHLGTPAEWRHKQHLPGSGTWYVLLLSVLQLGAALLTLVLIRPGQDRMPVWAPFRAGRRLPTGLVANGSGVGIAALAFLCVESAVHWDKVDPFSGAPATGWAWLCWICYAIALLWPVLLCATTIGYVAARGRRRA